MPSFSSFNPARRFACAGMCLNRPIDAIPDAKYAFAYNVRSYTEGRIEGRPGLAPVFSFAGGGNDYIHSGYTLGDYDPDTSGGPVRFAGFNTTLHAGVSPPSFPDTFTQIDSGFSGNPLSMVANTPEGNTVPWLYVYDSLQQRKYSQTFLSAGLPVPYQIGLPVPHDDSSATWFRPSVGTAAGNLTGNYYYRIRLRDPNTGIKSFPGPPTYSTVNLVTQKAVISLPSIANSADPSGFFTVDIFRFGGVVNDWRLVGSALANGNDFDDNLADSNVGSDPNSLLDQSRFQPWLSQDITRTIQANVAAATAGTGTGDGNGSIISRTGGDSFNPNWLPGTSLVIVGPDFSDTKPATLIRFISANSIEIQEDLGNITGVTVKVIGALESGKPLPYVWGPYGSGQTGLVFFACGDPREPGTVKWTVGNDPDSVALVGSLAITDASEPLQNGCVYNGRSYCWSSERMWELIPDGAGGYIEQVIPGAKGLFANWCFAVADFMYFRAKDGIYRTSGSGIPEPITDEDLYPLFEHDGQPGYTIQIPNPENFAQPIQLNPPDPNQLKAQRLVWGDGELRFDYREANTGLNKTLVWAKFPTQQGPVSGWVLDDFMGNIDGFTFAWWEKGTTLGGASTPAHSLLIGVGATLYQFGGVSDGGTAITSSVMTGAMEVGGGRAGALIGDAWVNAVPNGATMTARLLGTNNTIQLSTANLVDSGGGNGFTILDVNAGKGQIDRTCGLWVTWTASAQTAQIHEYNFSWVPKPETIQKRATDWTDDGHLGSKYWKAVVIEANVGVAAQAADLAWVSFLQVKTTGSYLFGASDIGSVLQITGGFNWRQGTYIIQSVAPGGLATLDHSPGIAGTPVNGSYILSGNRSVQLQYDGGSVAATITLAHAGQSEQPYVVPAPVVCREMRLLPVDSSTCQIFSVRYIWDKYPEYLPQIEDYSLDRFGSNKYVRGVRMEGDTQGTAINFAAQYDGGASVAIPGISQTGKTLTVIGFAAPFLASEIRLVPFGSWRRFSVEWIFDPYPDLAQVLTSIVEIGNPGAKFMQGIRLTAHTNNIAVGFNVLYDGNQLGAVLPPTKFNGKQTIPFSFDTPFIAHNLQIQPLGDAGIFVEESEWVWEPAPDLAGNWQTQPTDHNLPGYHHVRDAWIAYQSAPGATMPEILTITTEYGAVQYSLPASLVYTRRYIVLHAQKAKWRTYQFSSVLGVRAFVKDTVFRVKGWGEGGAAFGQYAEYNHVAPFGDLSRASGARL